MSGFRVFRDRAGVCGLGLGISGVGSADLAPNGASYEPYSKLLMGVI